MKLFSYTLSVIRAIVIILGIVAFLSGYFISCIFIKHSKKRALKLRHNFLKYFCIPVLNIQIKLEGELPSGKGIYICNHRSFTDPLVICRYVDAFVIAKNEVSNYPLINIGAELTGVIWVDRDSKESRKDTRFKMVETIDKGYNILVFPEGTVSTTPQTLPFKVGTFMEAAQRQIPVFPMAIEYKSKKDLWLVNNFVLLFLRQYSKWKTEVKLRFGQEIPFNDNIDMATYAHEWVNASLHEMQINWSEAFTQ